MAQNERVTLRDSNRIYREKLDALIKSRSKRIGGSKTYSAAIMWLIDKAYYDEQRREAARSEATK